MRERNGFTLIELLVVVAIIALLVALLLPALNEARAVAKRSVCATNIHSLILGVHLYDNDHNEIPNRSNYAWGYAPNYLVLGYGHVPDAMEKNTGDFSVMYPYYLHTPDAFYCPDGPYYADEEPVGAPGETYFAHWAPWHNRTARIITYGYLGRWDVSVNSDGTIRDINGDKVEIADSLADASPEAVLITDWNWYNARLNLHWSGNHPPLWSSTAPTSRWKGKSRVGIRDGTNTGRVDGSVVWVNESDTIPRLYKHTFYWEKY